MTILAWLASLIMPACGYAGALGLPPPPPMNPAAIVRPASPNTALAGPEAMTPIPDIFVPPYHVPAARLFQIVEAVAAEQPRTYLAVAYPDRLQAHYVARSAWFNFPDQIMVQVIAAGADHSELILWSRSVYGHSDLGANHDRLTAWLAALQARFVNIREK